MDWKKSTLRTKSLFPLLTLFFVFLAAAGSVRGQKGARTGADSLVAQLIARIETRYGKMRGLAAEFEHSYSAPGVRARREYGRLLLARPRRMRWEYDSNPRKLFIVNGREVWFYVPADREAVRADVRQVSDARFPFLFLLGQTNLRREFGSISLIEQAGLNTDTHLLRLLPRSRATGLREILLEVHADGRIIKVKMVDEAGAISEVLLKGVRENSVAPAEAFDFHPPPGVTVRRQK
jgi:outer membrane lipoprotein carrier protein